MMHFEVLVTPPLAPEKNMQIDMELLNSLSQNPRIVLHFYQWNQISATYGYFIDPDKLLNKSNVKRYEMSLARRPTGGGIIFHHCDLAFSVLIPSTYSKLSINTLYNYALVNHAVLEAIKDFNTAHQPILLKNQPLDSSGCDFCMAKPTVYDVILEDKKVGGGAQRRTKHGLLHQGSIALTLPYDVFLKDILLDSSIYQEMRQNGFYLLGENASSFQLKESRQILQFLLFKNIKSTLS